MIAPMVQAFVDEVFSSVQGEGPWIGERHIFVRFMGCDLRCRYCDTPVALALDELEKQGRPCRVQTSLRSFSTQDVPNPLSPSDLTQFCSRLTIRGSSRPTLSLTGGEPLLHWDFLGSWLPEIGTTYRVYLETNGIHYEAMKDLAAMIDVVSMDVKLPSSTGLRPFWEEHRKFLACAAGREIFVKAVVTGDTVQDDVLEAASLVSDHDAGIPLVLQPATGKWAPKPLVLLDFQEAALGIVRDVRVIPQAHKVLKLP